MIHFRPLSDENRDWEYQPDFYLHGKLSTMYGTDLVTMKSSKFKNKLSRFYLRGRSLPIYCIDIPEGHYPCKVNNIPCMLYTWKVINIGNSIDCWVCSQGYSGQFDISLRQLGLIVALSDSKGLNDAKEKFNIKASLI